MARSLLVIGDYMKKITAVFTALFLALMMMGGPAFADKPDDKPSKVLICHATGSETNPYVLIEVSENALKGHFKDGHQENEDILNPESGVCPGPTETPKPTPTETPTDSPTTPTEPTTPDVTPDVPTPTAPVDTPTVPDETPNEDKTPGIDECLGDNGEDLCVEDSPTTDTTTDVPKDKPTVVVPTAVAAGVSTLPNTGGPMWLLVICGLAMATAGGYYLVANRLDKGNHSH